VRERPRPFRTAATTLLALAIPALVRAQAGASGSPADAYDWAFRFASAIASDAKDRAKAQETVVLELIERKELDHALALVDRVEGWRGGTARADLAMALAQAGRREQALPLVERAESLGHTIHGWEGVRIESHVAAARAALGQLERAQETSSKLAAADERQYAGRAAATLALGQAARGQFTQAMQALQQVEDNDDYEVAWWRTSGYLGLARRTDLSREQRLEALAAARDSAVRIAGWKQQQALEEIADEYHALGREKDARQALEAAQATMASLSQDSPDRAPLLANLARAWGRLGQPERARELLVQAASLIPSSLVIDQPGLHANLALGYLTIGDAGETRRHFDGAFAAAEALANSRPRALAAVEICIALGRGGQPLAEPDRARLDSLLRSLGEPW
jgi:hypothetical protein